MPTEPGYRHVTAYLCAKGAAQAIDFYTRAFDARETMRMDNPDGSVGHAEITIGATALMLSDEAPEFGVFSPATLKGSSTAFVLEVEDVDTAVKHAVDAGATLERPATDEPYGRIAWLVDPFGHRWSLHTTNPNFDPSQMA
ncbi:MAG: VOC family protein [Tepidiformaceae bacterium]